MSDQYDDDELDPSLLAMMGEIPQSTALLNIDSIQIQGLNDMMEGANYAVGQLEEQGRGNEEEEKEEGNIADKESEGEKNAENDQNKPNKAPEKKPKQKEGAFFNKRIKHSEDELATGISDAERLYEMTKQNPVTRNLFVWLKRMKLRRFRPERIRNDLANGYVVAEILSRFFPAQISTHSFDLAIHAKAKQDNWKQLQKFFRKYSEFGEVLKQRDINALCDPTVGIKGNDSGIHVLLDVYRFLFKCELVPNLSSWGQGAGKLPLRNPQANDAALFANLKEGKAAMDSGEKRKSAATKEKPVQLSAAEQARLDEMHTFMGYRLTLDLLEKLTEAIQKMPGMTPKSSSMSGKVHVNVSKIFNVFDMDMTKDIDLEEFVKVIRKDLKISKKKVSTENLQSIFQFIDKDKSKAVTLQEFATFSREAQKAKKSGALDDEKKKREREKSMGKDLTKGKAALLEEKAEKVKRKKAALAAKRKVGGKAGESRSRSPSPKKGGKGKTSPKEKKNGIGRGRNRSPSPRGRSSPQPASKPELTPEEIRAVQARNQKNQQRRRTLRTLAGKEGPPEIAPLPVLTRKDNIPGHGDRRISKLVAEGFMPESPKRKGKKLGEPSFHGGKEVGKGKAAEKASPKAAGKAAINTAADAVKKAKATATKKAAGNDVGKEKIRNGKAAAMHANKKEESEIASSNKKRSGATGAIRSKAADKALKGRNPGENKKMAKEEDEKRGGKNVPTKPAEPKPSKAMTSPRGKNIKESKVEVVLKKPPKKGRIIKRGGSIKNKEAKKEKEELAVGKDNSEVVESVQEYKGGQKFVGEGQQQYGVEGEQQYGGEGQQYGVGGQQYIVGEQPYEGLQHFEREQQYHYMQNMQNANNHEMLHNPSTIIEEGESLSSGHTNLGSISAALGGGGGGSLPQQQQKIGEFVDAIGMDLELIKQQNQEAVQQQEIQLQQQGGFYGGGQGGYGMQMPMDSYHHQQMMYQQPQLFYGQERQQSQQSAVSSTTSSQPQQWPPQQKGGFNQQMQMQMQMQGQGQLGQEQGEQVQVQVQGQEQPVMQPQMPPPMSMYQQNYALAYPGFSSFDAYGGGPAGGIAPGQRYAQAGGPFVAGIPVLHVLKTPRDPTQRLSGVAINTNRAKIQPSPSPEL